MSKLEKTTVNGGGGGVTGNSYGFINKGYTPLTLDLGGHTLTVNSHAFYFANTTTTAG